MASKSKFVTYGGAPSDSKSGSSAKVSVDPAIPNAKPHVVLATSYQYSRIYPVEKVTETVPVATQYQPSIEIPAKVINLSKTKLAWDWSLDAQGAGTYQWIAADTFGMVDAVRLTGVTSGTV